MATRTQKTAAAADQPAPQKSRPDQALGAAQARRMQTHAALALHGRISAVIADEPPEAALCALLIVVGETVWRAPHVRPVALQMCQQLIEAGPACAPASNGHAA